MVGIAQLVEHLVVVQDVAGSNPVTHPRDSFSTRLPKSFQAHDPENPNPLPPVGDSDSGIQLPASSTCDAYAVRGHAAWYGPHVTRLDRSSWFAIAARLLAEQGAQGLRVDMLGQATGVAKGSFYHHFRQLAEFKAEFTDIYTSPERENPCRS